MNKHLMKTAQGAIFLAMTLSVPGVASAEEAGRYFGVGLGQATVDEDLCEGDPTCSDDVTDTAFRLFFGTQLSERAAIEFGYRDLGAASLSASFLGSTLTGKWESTGFDVSIVASSPLGQSSSLFGRIGFLRWDVDLRATLGTASGSESDSGIDLIFGFGGEFAFSKSVGMRVEYEVLTVGDDSATGKADINVISASLVTRF